VLDYTKTDLKPQKKEHTMIGWAITFLVIALIAAILGFGGIAAVSVEIAQILFVVFIALFVIALVMNAMRGKSPPT
jgi:uncharacterized membrane protein YtjA (UPF0391 family)